MKTLSFELSKRLNELGLLDDIETEYGYLEKNYEGFNKGDLVKIYGNKEAIYIKTLTLEEAIEFLRKINHEGNLNFNFNKKSDIVDITYMAFQKDIMTENEQFVNTYVDISEIITGKTLLEAIEKMIKYLIDNNLLGKH